jgi:hypothetical protein
VHKLHGSINWVNTMTVQVGGWISNTQVRGGEVVPVQNVNEFEASLHTNELGAVMSMYEPSKSVLNSPDVIERVQSLWAAHVLGANIIVCIGVRYVPHDRHIWGLRIRWTKHNGQISLSVQ